MIPPPIKKDRIVTRCPRYCFMMMPTRLNMPIPAMIPPKTPNRLIQLPAFGFLRYAKTAKTIIGSKKAMRPRITRKTYPIGCRLLKLSSESIRKNAAAHRMGLRGVCRQIVAQKQQPQSGQNAIITFLHAIAPFVFLL